MVFLTSPEGDNINYWFTTRRPQISFQSKTGIEYRTLVISNGNSVIASEREESYTKGKIRLKLLNENYIDGVNVN